MSNLPDEFRGVAGNLKEQRAARRLDLQKIQSDAEQISALVADPRWEFYGRYLEVRKKAADLAIEAMGKRLLNTFLPRDEYAQLCNKLAEQRGLSTGLAFALSIAQVIIEQGEVAAQELAGLAG